MKGREEMPMPLALLVKGFYSVMVMTVLSMMWGYARGLTSGRQSLWMAKMPFAGWIGFLVAISIVFHVLTAWQVPWVAWELQRTHLTPDHDIAVTAQDHQFHLPDDGIRIMQGELVRFRVRSEDLTYGFGVFREDGRMEFQMQVVPGHDNDLVWVFSKPGRYSVRSTEYAGPHTWTMYAKDVIEVASDLRVASR
jgi:cytochrome c oxidase subunit 2